MIQDSNTGKTISFSKSVVISLGICIFASIPFLIDNILLFPAFLVLSVIAFYLFANRFAINQLHFLYFYLFLSILSPPLELTSSFPRIRLDEILIYCIFPFFLLYNLKDLELRKNALIFIAFFSFFLFSVCLSTLYGKSFLGVPVGQRDIFEIITLSKYLFAFITIYSFDFSLDEFKKILNFILILICASGIFGLIQFFGLLGIDDITAPLYLLERTHLVDQRLTATHKNPNSYSIYLVFGHIIALSLYFVEKSKSKKVLLLISLVFILILLFFAGSRTMFASYIFVTGVLILIFSIQKGLSTKQIAVILTSLSLVFIISLSFISVEIASRLESGIDILSDDSFGMRILIWYLNISIFLESPILGWGPAKDYFTATVDNEYILILRRYGIFGFLSYIFIYLHPLYLSYKGLKNDAKNNVYHIITFTILITVLIGCLTNSVLHDLQLMGLFIVFLALYYRQFNNLGIDTKSIN